MYRLVNPASSSLSSIPWRCFVRPGGPQAARPVDIAFWLFCTRHGDCYARENGTANARKSMWGRFMDRVLNETTVKERFTKNDLRARCASDADGLAHAQHATRSRRQRHDREDLPKASRAGKASKVIG